FTRVLMQQGRVQLDADWNEQAAIFWNYIRTLATHLIGPHGGPAGDVGFEIEPPADNDFKIGEGQYYVNGILCRNPVLDEYGNEHGLNYKNQPFYPVPDAETLPNIFLVYLDVWERHITHVEDHSIREVALKGPDTATRAQRIWQVKWCVLDSAQNCNDIEPKWDELVKQWQPENRGQLKAKAKGEEDLDDRCNLPPESRYRGNENHLYRVEIHEEGEAGEGRATFKWSRDNGSHIFSIRSASGAIVTVNQLGRDDCSLKVGDWVEIMDDDRVLRNELPAEGLLKVDAINPDTMEVTLVVPDGTPIPVYDETSTKHPLLRRWDQKATSKVELTKEGIIAIKDDWLDLEDGIQICFKVSDVKVHYRRGDYWLIPARTATGDVEWPKDADNQPLFCQPHGIDHYYAPLAVISVGDTTTSHDCRYEFELTKRPVSA
ncbi:MAG: hypothetical protein KAV87_29465, partial [Desulfobacteraceae bacterium]|nr:hypothetical protein [Desulfobacteraceae bacterium]